MNIIFNIICVFIVGKLYFRKYNHIGDKLTFTNRTNFKTNLLLLFDNKTCFFVYFFTKTVFINQM